MANQSFNQDILGEPVPSSAAAPGTIPLIQSGNAAKAAMTTITPYSVVGPSRGDDTAMLQSAFNGSASRPVFLSFGTYDVRGPLTIPNNGVVVSEEINAWDFYNGAAPRTNLRINNSAYRFSSGQAVLTVGNYCHIRGFSIFGLRNVASHPRVNGVAVANKAFVTIEDIWINLCYDGIYAVSDGSIAGGSPWGNNIIGLRVFGGGLLYNEDYGLATWGQNGGYFSDSHLNKVQVVGNVSGGLLLGAGTASTQLLNCRIEDQGAGLLIDKAFNIQVGSCIFDRNGAPIYLSNDYGVTVSGCSSNAAGNTGSGTGGIGTHVRFGGVNNAINFAANNYFNGAQTTTSVYGVDAGGTIAGCFAESGCPEANSQLYQDAYSRSVVAPLRIKMGP